MKLFTFYSTLLVASLTAIGLAEIAFDPLPLRLYTGNSCELHWTTDRDYNLELLLVQRFDEDGLSGWTPIEMIFQDQYMAMGNGSYNWTIPGVREHDFSYSLWLSGNNSANSGYANLTSRFHIESESVRGRRLISLGEIAGAVAGLSVCLLMFATATAALLRLTRQKGRLQSDIMEQAFYYTPSDFDSIMDEKAELRPVMKEHIVNDDKHRL